MNCLIVSPILLQFAVYCSCEFVIIAPTRYQNNGKAYLESLDFTLPNHQEIRVTRNPSPFRHVLLKLHLIIDNRLYLRWLKMSGEANKAKEAIHKHYAQIIEGVRERFRRISSIRYTYDVTLAGMSIDEKSQSITDQENVKTANENVIDYKKVLVELSKEMARQKENLPKFNVVLAFTIYSDQSGSGKANSGSICTPDAMTILKEDENMSDTIEKASNLIGEILGARALDDCHVDDGLQSGARAAPGKGRGFSACSVKQFEILIDSFNSWLRRDCLLDIRQQPRSKRDADDYDDQYTPDNMCRYYLGAGSYYCPPGSKAKDKVCEELVCYAPNNNTCFKIVSTYTHDGFSCGNKKWCIDGYCEENNKAPEVEDEQCVYGDYPHYLKFNHTMLKCKQLLKRRGYCYYSYFSENCCATCKKMFKAKAPEDCRYGDYVANIRVGGNPVSCDYANQHLSMCYRSAFRSACCGTCLDLLNERRPRCLEGDYQLEVRFIDKTVTCVDLNNHKTMCERPNWFQICCGTCSDILEQKQSQI